VVVLIGDVGAGKSTFAVGLVKCMVRNDSVKGQYFTIIGSEESFQRNVIDRMEKDLRYPEPTHRGDFFVININIRSRLRGRVISVLDLPGEVQSRIIYEGIIEGEEYKFNEIEGIQEDIKRKIKHKEVVEPEEWKKLFYYYITQSKGIILLVKADKCPSDDTYIKIFESKIIKRKKRKCLIISACDRIGYNPDEYKVPLIFPRFFDYELAKKIKERWGINGNNLINYLMSKGIDLLGVAVPADKNNPEALRMGKDGSFETQGFGGVKQWILK